MLVVPLAGLALIALTAACGGDDGAGKGRRVTDPAAVPSSTPIQNPVVYRIENDEVIVENQTTRVPAGQTPGAARTHKVESGQNCGEIAALYGITIDELIKANRQIDANCTNLKADDTLRIPTKVPTGGTTPVPGSTRTPPASGREYVVRPGDNCGTIAANHGVAVADLIRVNGLDADCTNLKPDQVLKIP